MIVWYPLTSGQRILPRRLEVSLFHQAITTVSIASVSAEGVSIEDDEVSVEEPLELVVKINSSRRSLAVTMRTPGADQELVAGFLLTEGIIATADEVVGIETIATNVIEVALNPRVAVDYGRLERQSFVSSSCGVCGKRSIAAVFAAKRHELRPGQPQIRSNVVHGLSQTLRHAQSTFGRTGGLHAAALFDGRGELLSLFEDVGRHNAVDKLIGHELLAGHVPLGQHVLFLSGRASFELIQKAAMPGIPVVAAVGAPSSLAVSLARECSMTLLGFVRDGRFNVYADADRLISHHAG